MAVVSRVRESLRRPTTGERRLQTPFRRRALRGKKRGVQGKGVDGASYISFHRSQYGAILPLNACSHFVI